MSKMSDNDCMWLLLANDLDTEKNIQVNEIANTFHVSLASTLVKERGVLKGFNEEHLQTSSPSKSATH